MPATPFVGVIGAGGQTGRRIIAELARRRIHNRGLVRSPRSAEAARKAGADETISCDLSDEASLASAVAGLDTLVLIAPPFDASEEEHAANALAAASVQYIGHFVYYSVLHPYQPRMPHHLRKLHAEELVRDAGARWTILQPSMYQQNLLGMVRGADDGVIRVPYSPAAPFQLVDLNDVAEVAAQVCADPDDHAYATYELAGPERASTAEMVERIGRAVGAELRAVQIPLGEWRPPAPPTMLDEMHAMATQYDRTGLPGNPNVLRFLLGRPPTSIADTARRELTGG